jgi:hypothetical protein
MIQKVVDTINANKNAIGVNGAEEISEDWSKNLKPPYCGVFADTEEESEQVSTMGDLIDIPISIKIVCCSSEKRTARDAMNEAWSIARKILQYVKGEYTFNQADLETDPGKPTYTVLLRPKRMPREILSKTAKQSVVQVNLFYNDPYIA